MSDNKPPADEALLNMGQVYADPENPQRDFSKSITYFQRITDEYPESNWAESARIWTATLKEHESVKRVVFETLEENEKARRLRNEALQESERLKRLSNETAQENQRLKRLSNETAQENQRLKRLFNETAQEIQSLKQIVEQLKAVDVEVEEKKKGRGQ